MKQNEYAPRPTAAAIDTAVARALSFESERCDSGQADAKAVESPSISDRILGRVGEIVGQQGSFERGFVQTVLLIIGGLLVGRLVTDHTTLLGAVVPLAFLASYLTYKVIRGIEPSRRWLATRPRQIAMGLACSPALTWLSQGSFNRCERATVWTAWAAAVIGLAAFTTG